jgi:hypothetical protein
MVPFWMLVSYCGAGKGVCIVNTRFDFAGLSSWNLGTNKYSGFIIKSFEVCHVTHRSYEETNHLMRVARGILIPGKKGTDVHKNGYFVSQYNSFLSRGPDSIV